MTERAEPRIAPRGLSRAEAAAYVGVSPSLFDRLVAEGTMPKPKRLGARCVYDRTQLDSAFDAIGGGELDTESNEWD
ncbi:MAG: helix-turn-helix transcriptional regulator [Hyphomonadaceae bacterium]